MVGAGEPRRSWHGPDEAYLDFVARAGRNGLARKAKLADLADNMDLDRLALVEKAKREELLYD